VDRSPSYRLEPQETALHQPHGTAGVAIPTPHAAAGVASPWQHDPGIPFRHSGWARNRELVHAALVACGVSDARLNSFEVCGSETWVLRDPDDPDHYRLAGNFCHDRFCKPCAGQRSRRIAANLRKYLQPHAYRFLTLTLRSDTESLADLLNLLLRSFRTLRRTEWWRHLVRGGCGFVEIKWSQHKQRWHPHLHVILESAWLEKSLISGTWYRITGQSFIVDIRPIRDTDAAIGYITKYASKPLNNTFLARPERLQEAITALGGRRLCMTFGTWVAWKLYDLPEKNEWFPVCSLRELLNRVASGHPGATRIFNCLRNTLRHEQTATRCNGPPRDDDDHW